jgi:hypothetical protein
MYQVNRIVSTSHCNSFRFLHRSHGLCSSACLGLNSNAINVGYPNKVRPLPCAYTYRDLSTSPTNNLGLDRAARRFNRSVSITGKPFSTTSRNNNNNNAHVPIPSYQVLRHSNESSLNIVLRNSEKTESSDSNLTPLTLSPLQDDRFQEKLTQTPAIIATTENDFVQGIASEIERHYAIENSEQFVGGMGENDGGVWIVSDGLNDTLDYWEFIKGA